MKKSRLRSSVRDVRMSAADHNGLSTFSIVLTQIENGKFAVAK
jgi:hypothetical protein